MQFIKDTLIAMAFVVMMFGALALADHKESQLENHTISDYIERDRQAAVVEARHASSQH